MAVIVLAVVLAAASCGLVEAGPTVSATPLPATEAMAYTATMNANSADVYLTFAFSAGHHKIDVTSTESGPFSWSANQGEFETTVTVNGQKPDGSRQIIDGQHTYTKDLNDEHLPASIASAFPSLLGWQETTWSGASSGDLSQLFFSFFIGPANPPNPASLLALLRAQASSIEDLGGAVLSGISSTHYRAFVPLSHLGPMSAADLEQAEQMLGSSFLSFDYWIDSADLLRQLAVSITINAPPQPSDTPSYPGEIIVPFPNPITMSTSFQLSDYGTPVHIVLPPPSQITSHASCVTTPEGDFNCTI